MLRLFYFILITTYQNHLKSQFRLSNSAVVSLVKRDTIQGCSVVTLLFPLTSPTFFLNSSSQMQNLCILLPIG